jgi:hypothetical protein
MVSLDLLSKSQTCQCPGRCPRPQRILCLGYSLHVLGEYPDKMQAAWNDLHPTKDSFAQLDPPCEAELDMLDLAYEPTETSRLGCQIIMSKSIDGITVTIPAGVNNLWG